MAIDDTCRELAAQMTDDDLLTGHCTLDPDSPLLPTMRTELRRRLAERPQNGEDQ